MKKEANKPELPRYEAPTITTYSDEELLEKLGPALTFDPGGS